jgi:predicted HD superfamily hydrolase involved in NAD metabolism
VSRSPELLGRARVLLAARLSPDSLEHCERVASTAVVLAVRFGVDPSDAELAGLLHDYARDEPSGSLVETADRLGVPATGFEREHPYLLHARVGAAMVRRDLPGVGEAVLSAISVHTVGAVPMSDLDRVVFIADMIEPARAFPGVETVRTACEGDSLAECFRVGYGRSVRHVRETGRALHPITAVVSAGIERETGHALFDPPAVSR